MTSATPWRAMLAAARELAIAPNQFWRLSLREWRAITALRSAAESMPRAAFERLAQNFPDEKR
ncbi:MAG: phage tail assembly chaperone [Terricaulis sp.]